MIGSYESISQFENAIRGKNTLFYRPVNFIFVFISIILGDGSRKVSRWIMPESVLPMFSSKSLLVSSVTFRSLIHFEFIFVYGVRK